MRILARRGNRLHAPESTRMALISAYTAGAGALELDVQMTRDGQLVVTHDPAVADVDFAELRTRSASASFKPRGAAAGYRYRPGRKPDVIERFGELLDLLPHDVPKLIGLGSDELVPAAAEAIASRHMIGEVVLTSADAAALKHARELLPGVRIVPPEAIVDIGEALGPAGGPADGGGSELGLVVRVDRDVAVPTAEELRALAALDFVWAVSTDSMLDIAELVRSPQLVVEESFAGTTVDTDRFALGYAKANRYCHVFQDDGVHVRIAEWDGDLPPTQDPLELRLRRIEERLWYALRDWPFYSGGGLGVLHGLEGDFAAEIDYTTTRAGQASTLEMALVNVDPSKHQEPWNPDGTPRLPQTIHDKSIFFDPHGAPPFVGSEHDEDDGYRINANLGTDYDDNQWGRPVGNGTALAARLRVERRGAFFSAYYRNDEAPDWVCTGATRNDSMNPRVFLRCAGKRWRQEREEDTSQYYPIVPVEFVFRDLAITRWWPPPDAA
jgi:hypothetical protein